MMSWRVVGWEIFASGQYNVKRSSEYGNMKFSLLKALMLTRQSALHQPILTKTKADVFFCHAEPKSSGLWGWLGNVIAPQPKQQQQSLIS